MNILMSIKPKFAKKIFQNEKRVEFRKVLSKELLKAEKVFVYASSPIKKIVGYFTIKRIYFGDVNHLWTKYSEIAGISEKAFFKYFNGKEKGYAIEIEQSKAFTLHLDPYLLDAKFHPPQSYLYLDHFHQQTQLIECLNSI